MKKVLGRCGFLTEGAVALCLASLALGLGLANLSLSEPVTVVREGASQYRFINPLLFVDNSEQHFPELDALGNQFSRQVSDLINSGAADKVSVYYRDLNSSHWTGVNQKDLFAPSSMLKIVTLMAYLHHAEDDPSLLLQNVAYKPAEDPGQYYKPAKMLPAGIYPVKDLLVQMIVESDNSAMSALNVLYPEYILQVYRELELPDPTSSGDSFMSPEEYSRVYRTLYGSTYLSRDYSEQALDLLSHTTFSQGLIQATASTTVSHKFGEHTLLDDKGGVVYRELHDCGIVYVPGHPYFLCVMTRGRDFAKLERVIGGISQTAYDFVIHNQK